MTDRERRGWIVVSAIFVATFFIWGAINSSVVFFVPVLKHFGWTRAKLAFGLNIGWATGGLAGPLIGWIADRVNPKWMMVIGGAVTGALWLFLSRTTMFAEFLTANSLFGISVGAATTIPSLIIIAGWFERQRGLAIGIVYAAAPIGGVLITPIVNHIIAISGWRAGYAALGVPILIIGVPLVLLLVRPGKSTAHVPLAEEGRASTPVNVPGLEFSEALENRSFWLICAVQAFVGFTLGMGTHFVAYMTGLGYSSTFAAYAVSAYLSMTAVGALMGGRLADWTGARGGMMATCILGAIGAVGLMSAAHPAGLAVNIVAGGFALGALGVEMPLVIVDSLGAKRFGTLVGVTGTAYTAAAFVSPIIAGRVFDTTGSYQLEIGAFVVVLILASLALAGCRSYGSEGEQVPTPAPSAAA